MCSISVEPMPSRIGTPVCASQRSDTAAESGSAAEMQARAFEKSVSASAGRLEHRRVQRRDGEEQGGGVARDRLEDAVRLRRPAHEHGGGAGRQREREAVAEPVGVEELGRRVAEVVLGDLEHVPRVGVDRRADVAMGVDDALRPAGRARAVEPERHVVRVRVGGRLQLVGLRRHGVVEARVSTRVAVGHEHGQRGAALQRRLDLVEQRRLDDEHLRVAVVEVVGVVVGAVHRVDGDRHRADADRPEERRVEDGRVVEHHHHAVLAADAELAAAAPRCGR